MASTSRHTRNDEIGEWTRMKKLGEGGFGSVYIGKRKKDGKFFAVKSVYFVPQVSASTAKKKTSDDDIYAEECALSSLINEIRTLKKLKSAYIVRYLGCGTSKPPEMGSRLVLDCYLEFLPRGCLFDLLETALDENFIKAYTKDILHGLAYLHYNKIVHGDLKSENILIDSTNCKIADFGSVKDVRTSFLKKILYGTTGYMAPEVLEEREQTYASDIFSLGCTVVFMATGQSDVTSDNATQILDRPPDIPDCLSMQGQDFLSKCLALDPGGRWSAKDLLKHPFIMEPSSPRWKPYDIPLDPGLEAKLLKLDPNGLTLIIPPDDIYSGGPISPIPTMPLKRRRIDACCQNLDETDVALPTDRRPVETESPKTHALGMEPAETGNSAIGPRLRFSKRKRAPIKQRKARTTVAKDAIIRIKRERRRAHKSSESQGSSVSVTYQGYKVEISPVAQLEGNGDKEDKDPLVVKICDEFGIPLPPEYQKWILDPDYDPDADVVANPGAATDNMLKNPLKIILRVGKKALKSIGGRRKRKK